MRLRDISFILLLIGFTGSAQNALSGLVRDAESGDPLVGANVSVPGYHLGTATDGDGFFRFASLPAGATDIRVEYLGYRPRTVSLAAVSGDLVIELAPSPLQGREMVVVGTRAVRGETPAAFSNLDREAIETRYHTQDIPAMLSDLPSVTFYSEGGNAIGYNYLSIRGFGQRRISVMINGIPQNDPEDHNVYWLDFPDLLGVVEDIQVQRGAGSAFFGPPAIGGSVNIITSNFSSERSVSVYSGIGSYNTSKLALGYNSGLLKDRFVLSGRVSRLQSDSYRNSAAVDFKSYFLGAAWFGDRQSLRLHAYGGPIEDELAYAGISKEAAQDRDRRRENPIDDPREIENFNQPHFEAIHTWELSPSMTLQNSLFHIRGYGFFDYDGSWAPASYYRLTPAYGFDVSGDPTEVYFDDVLIRAFVDNKQFGWFPQLTWSHGKGTMVAGSELRYHRSLHWGRMQEASGGLPEATAGTWAGRDYVGERRYYSYRGGKDVIAPYAQTTWRLRPSLNLHLALQYVYQTYHLYDEKFIGTDFDLTYHFLNPRVGLNLKLTPTTTGFISVSRTEREPRLKNFYDAAEASTPEAWGAVVPQFERNTDGSFNFDEPLVNPERLTDVEIGLGYQDPRWTGDVNLYFMYFEDEIISQGQLDRFGQPVTGNANLTEHMGIELSGAVQLTPAFSLYGNLTLSRNELVDYTEYDGGDPVELDGNTIAGFPDILGNLRGTFDNRWVNVSLTAKHVGRQYTTNRQDEAFTVDAYTVLNGTAGLKLQNFLPVRGQLQFHVMNLLDELYITHGEGGDFFPAAERHFFTNLRLEL